MKPKPYAEKPETFGEHPRRRREELWRPPLDFPCERGNRTEFAFRRPKGSIAFWDNLGEPGRLENSPCFYSGVWPAIQATKPSSYQKSAYAA